MIYFFAENDEKSDTMILKKEAAVSAGVCDPNVRLAVSGAFDLLQDYLTEMLGEQSLDGVSLREKCGCAWIFTRNRVEIDRALSWKERYTAESFISSAKGAKMTVDTVFKDEKGMICVYSRVEMCALDLTAQKIRRIRDVGVTSDDCVETPQREINFSRLKHEGLQKVDSVKVKSEDIDFIRHTNNVSYIRYIMNTYTVKELSERPVRAIEVRYAGQTHEGDTLDILKAERDGKELFDIVLGDTVVVECEIVR